MPDCRIFQDEIDALATSRASGDSDSGAGSHEGVLTSLLNEMDGVQELLGVTVVAATNRPDVIVRSLHFVAFLGLVSQLLAITGFGLDAARSFGSHYIRWTSRSEGSGGDS